MRIGEAQRELSRNNEERFLPYRFFDNMVDVLFKMVDILFKLYIYLNPNPNPNPMKRNNQPVYGETPCVSYTVCVNHVVEKVVSSTSF